MICVLRRTLNESDQPLATVCCQHHLAILDSRSRKLSLVRNLMPPCDWLRLGQICSATATINDWRRHVVILLNVQFRVTVSSRTDLSLRTNVIC
jgi:hypothetical protein